MIGEQIWEYLIRHSAREDLIGHSAERGPDQVLSGEMTWSGLLTIGEMEQEQEQEDHSGPVDLTAIAKGKKSA